MSRESKEQEELIGKIQALLEKKYGDSSLESMRKLFDAYDSNGDGKIDPGELEQLLADAGVGNRFTRGLWTKGVVDALDENADRAIDWDEFHKAVNQAP
jgi:Ca2+-binding EF-hand superfamily protein